MNILLNILLQAPINPNAAVSKISTEYGLLGSLFIIVLALLISALVFIYRNFKKQILLLNNRIDTAEKETKQARTDLFDYIENDHNVLIEVIKQNADSRDSMKIVLEKLLLKL